VLMDESPTNRKGNNTLEGWMKKEKGYIHEKRDDLHGYLIRKSITFYQSSNMDGLFKSLLATYILSESGTSGICSWVTVKT
jgi:hypothetical protein